jgi:hypothetical protein
MPERMARKLPAPVAALVRRLEAYRNNRHRQQRLPEELWAEAARLVQGQC